MGKGNSGQMQTSHEEQNGQRSHQVPAEPGALLQNRGKSCTREQDTDAQQYGEISHFIICGAPERYSQSGAPRKRQGGQDNQDAYEECLDAGQAYGRVAPYYGHGPRSRSGDGQSSDLRATKGVHYVRAEQQWQGDYQQQVGTDDNCLRQGRIGPDQAFWFSSGDHSF